MKENLIQKPHTFLKELREFATKGSVVDLALGIIIGGGFGKVVSSLVSDVIMPPIGLLIGGVNFTDIKFVLREATEVLPAITLNIGIFIQTLFDFVIVATVMFVAIKMMNKLRREEAKSDEQVVVSPDISTETSKEQILLLREIRDNLKK